MASLSAVSRQSHNDHEVRGFIICDALYAWHRGEKRYPQLAAQYEARKPRNASESSSKKSGSCPEMESCGGALWGRGLRRRWRSRALRVLDSPRQRRTLRRQGRR
jgi:hypothetical protein